MHARSMPSVVILGLTASVLSGGLLGGCGSQPRRSAGPAVSHERGAVTHRHASAREGVFADGLPGGSAGESSAVVFSSPDVQQYYIAVRPEVLGLLETRRDEDLAIYDPAPRTAIDSWPTDARASLDRPRYGRIQTGSPDSFIYYEVERECGRPGYWGDSGRSWDR